MDIFKEASRIGLTVPTSVGLLTVSQLWGACPRKNGALDLTILDNAAIALDEKLEKTAKKSYTSKRTAVDKNTQLQRDIVVAIIEDLVAEEEANANAKAVKAQVQEIDELIAAKQNEVKKNLSLDELKAIKAGLLEKA